MKIPFSEDITDKFVILYADNVFDLLKPNRFLQQGEGAVIVNSSHYQNVKIEEAYSR